MPLHAYFIAVVVWLFRLPDIYAIDDERTRLISRLEAAGVAAKWYDDQQGYSLECHGKVGRSAASLVNELKTFGPITGFYATAGPKSPTAGFFEALEDMPDVRQLAVGNISDGRVLRGVKVFRNVEDAKFFDVSIQTSGFPTLRHCRILYSPMRFSNKAIHDLLKMKELEVLAIDLASDVSIADVAQLKELKNLSKLILRRNSSKLPASFEDDIIRAMGPGVTIRLRD